MLSKTRSNNNNCLGTGMPVGAQHKTVCPSGWRIIGFAGNPRRPCSELFPSELG